ncbi:amidase family protein [Jejudonia soesokkakensis]|uniref:Amidase family protein n=1 Tax=Jejudonia soesokkakensis TaxID=1323432 RepID=A0ABW2MVD4_9FLAO
MKPTLYSLFAMLIICFSFISCQEKPETPREVPTLWMAYDETSEVKENDSIENRRLRYKLLQSKFTDRNAIFSELYWEVTDFPQERYDEIAPLILEKDIPSIQQAIAANKFTYEELTLFYLKRIYTYELDPKTSLYTIMALNPDVLEEARLKDTNKATKNHEIYGMPILLKDNISTSNMKTTAGAMALQENAPTKDAFIVSQLKKNGALILGKVNLSEWAYYFCNRCPLGYSAVGGQTLNPYGRKQFETGGSSAGSGTSVAANYAVAAVGTETAGSIISPTSQNSLVGLKPTVGVLSRSGIIPISHTLDTSGPMTKNTIDTAILLDAMAGLDPTDSASKEKSENYIASVKEGTLKGKRLGVMNGLLEDSIYSATIKRLEDEGAVIVTYDAPEIALEGFGTLLDVEMLEDLPLYLEEYASETVSVKSIQDVMAFNQKDSLGYMPYNQGIFDEIVADSTSTEDFQQLRATLLKNGAQFFDEPMQAHDLDAILSINNYHSGYAAVGLRPCLALPMGYKENGEPIALTFIGLPFSELELLKMGYAYEKANPIRKIPELFKN